MRKTEAATRAFLGVAVGLVLVQVSSSEGRPEPPLRLSNAALTLGLVPALGGRIVELRAAGGDNLLDADPRFWKEPLPPADLHTPFEAWNGHTYWVGPQSAWWAQQDVDAERRRKNAAWPPDPFHETARYEVRDRSRSSAWTESPPSPITGLRRRLEVELVGAQGVRIRVTATNVRTTPVAWSIYSNTRVRPDGWAYVRLDAGGIKRVDSPRDAAAAYPHRVVRGFFASPPGEKPAAGGAPRTADAFLRPVEGQIAYFRGHQLFLKRTEKFSEARLHPEETLVEIYRSSGGGGDAPLLELEMHGPYETLEPGQATSFEETWEVVDYPGPAEPGAHVDFLASSSSGSPWMRIQENLERGFASSLISPRSPEAYISGGVVRCVVAEATERGRAEGNRERAGRPAAHDCRGGLLRGRADLAATGARCLHPQPSRVGGTSPARAREGCGSLLRRHGDGQWRPGAGEGDPPTAGAAQG